jgi:hypothetical protein
MKHDIIKTDNYLLIVSDEKIKEDDYWVYICPINGLDYGDNNNPIVKNNFDTVLLITPTWFEKLHDKENYKKIIAHLPLNNSPILEGVDLLPPLEDDVDKLSADYTEEWCGKRRVDVYIHDAFKAGYNKAKEKYKYTEEDIDKAYWAGMKFVGEDKGSYKEFIQSLQQPKYPIGFEQTIGVCNKWLEEQCDNNCCGQPEKIMTTTNSQGQTVLVGTYIYE